MWLCDSKNNYDYICTLVDDFNVVTKNQTMWIKIIAPVFLVKELYPRNYYSCNDYIYHNSQQDTQTYVIQTYFKEAVTRIECIYRYLIDIYTSH